MIEPDLRDVRDDWSRGKLSIPQPFALVGYQSPYVVSSDGRPPLVIDAEGVVLLSGAVYAWCRTGCCGPSPRHWPSVEAAADYHGSYIVGPNGAVRAPDDPAA